MKRMTMAQAMAAAIKEVSKYDEEVVKVLSLEGSGNHTNGYDYLLIGVETAYFSEGYQEHKFYEAQVYCNEATNYKVAAVIIDERRAN